MFSCGLHSIEPTPSPWDVLYVITKYLSNHAASLTRSKVFAGGVRFSEQGFMVGASQLNSSLLTVSVVAILIPGRLGSITYFRWWSD
jgi:hypothetical protein